MLLLRLWSRKKAGIFSEPSPLSHAFTWCMIAQDTAHFLGFFPQAGDLVGFAWV
jgi:hypothetical protein